jgi:hypothetical protein
MRGGSWTEPTVYATLAALAAGEQDAADRGLKWIVSRVRPDGGWAPCGGVDESTWVTSLVALLPPERLGAERYEAAIQWLVHTTGHETELSYRLREFLLGSSPPPEQKFAGWPWVPGSAAWVGPTSIAILALQQAAHRRPATALADRVESGQKFLLARMCKEGGWNHGSVRALGYESRPYPETTGMALAALAGVKSAEVDRALGVARQFLAECRSADALNWLTLGLIAHGQRGPGNPPPAVTYRTTPETALGLLLAGEKGAALLAPRTAGARS